MNGAPNYQQRYCDICLQPRSLTQAIEGLTLPFVCHGCVKTINVVRGWLDRYGLEITQTHSSAERSAESVPNNNLPVEQQKSAE